MPAQNPTRNFKRWIFRSECLKNHRPSKFNLGLLCITLSFVCHTILNYIFQSGFLNATWYYDKFRDTCTSEWGICIEGAV